MNVQTITYCNQIYIFLDLELNKRCKQLRDQVMTEGKCNFDIIFKLLLNTAQLEFKLKEVNFKSVNAKNIPVIHTIICRCLKNY